MAEVIGILSLLQALLFYLRGGTRLVYLEVSTDFMFQALSLIKQHRSQARMIFLTQLHTIWRLELKLIC